eukprot:821188-Lingulodinium_polyedra.AAC.1
MGHPTANSENMPQTTPREGRHGETHVDVAASQGEPAGDIVAERNRLVVELITTRQGRTHADARQYGVWLAHWIAQRGARAQEILVPQFR